MQRSTTLSCHILEEHILQPSDASSCSTIMAQLAVVAKKLAAVIGRAGLVDVVGQTGDTNVQGEAVQKLDQLANETFLQVFDHGGGLALTLVSEEMEDPVLVPRSRSEGNGKGRYALFFDPLDGSSNVEANALLGSIFSIYRLDEQASAPGQGLLRPGTEQIAAGYILYGPSTVFVYSCGKGVHQFTLDRAIGEFLLSRPRLRVPPSGTVYSVNDGNYPKWSPGVQRFLEHLRDPKEAGKQYASRYSGCLVADVHRLLSSGGIYFYPAERKKPEGKLRLMYEAAPLAWLLEQAGGMASTGGQRILEVQPSNFHQRTPLFIGSKEEVAWAEEFLKGSR